MLSLFIHPPYSLLFCYTHPPLIISNGKYQKEECISKGEEMHIKWDIYQGGGCIITLPHALGIVGLTPPGD